MPCSGPKRSSMRVATARMSSSTLTSPPTDSTSLPRASIACTFFRRAAIAPPWAITFGTPNARVAQCARAARAWPWRRARGAGRARARCHEATGDQVHAALPNRRTGGWPERERLEALYPAPGGAQRDRAVDRACSQLSAQRFCDRVELFRAGVAQRDVDRARPNGREFTRDDARGAEQQRPFPARARRRPRPGAAPWRRRRA